MFLKIGDYVTLGPAKHLVEDKEGSLGAPKDNLQKQRVGFVTAIVGSCVNVRHGDVTSTYDPLSLRKVSVRVDEGEGEIKGWDNFGAGKKIIVLRSEDKKTAEYKPEEVELIPTDPRILSGGRRSRRHRVTRRRGGAMSQKQMALNRLAAQGLLSRTPTTRQLAIQKLGAIPIGPLRRRNTRRRR